MGKIVSNYAPAQCVIDLIRRADTKTDGTVDVGERTRAVNDAVVASGVDTAALIESAVPAKGGSVEDAAKKIQDWGDKAQTIDTFYREYAQLSRHLESALTDKDASTFQGQEKVKRARGSLERKAKEEPKKPEIEVQRLLRLPHSCKK